MQGMGMSEELDSPNETGTRAIPSWVWPLGIFLVVAVVYGLVSGDRIFQPSNQFHFVDLAHSYMDGHLDTETPQRRRGSEPEATDPVGYQEAIDRSLTNEKGEATGTTVGNDWSSYYVIRLKEDDSQELKGVWPWAHIKRPSSLDKRRKNHFLTLGGDLMIVDPIKDIARSCGDNGRSRCKEKVYHVSFPPFPAVVMIPAAKIWGYNTNDVLITVLFGALNAVLVFFLIRLLVRRGYAQRNMRETLWLVALFAFGTVAFFSSVRGEVWFTALVIGMTLNLGFVMAALDARHPFWAGLFLALGFATRTPLLFASIFFALQLWWPACGKRDPWKSMAVKVALFAIPTLTVGIVLMVLNYHRFDDALEFGHTYLAAGTRASIREHGLFSFEFLNRNLSSMLTSIDYHLSGIRIPPQEETKHPKHTLFYCQG